MASSYKQIAKSSGLIAFVSIFQMVFGLFRNKVIAVLLGTKGFGIYGLYQVFIETALSFSSLGLDKSGVRQIAKNSDNLIERDRCISVFSQGLLVTSIVTSILCVCFSKWISSVLFNSEDYAIGIVIASLAVLFRSISQGQISILNGLRDLKSLAISQIVAVVVGSLSSVLFVLLLGEEGIVLSFVSFGLTSLLFSYIYVRKQSIRKTEFNKGEFFAEFKTLLSLGLGFSVSAAVSSLFTFFSRSYIGAHFDIEVVGVYQACWIISNLYIGIILSAMGVDFMPRLMKSIEDHSIVRRMVNEQMEFGSLLAGIGVILLVLFAEVLLTLLYSKDFEVGSSIIRWQVLGVSLRVLGFPLAHSVMAFNKPVWYATIQCFFAFLEYVLLILFTKYFGFDGLGISYFIGYIFFMALWIFAAKKLFKFKFSKKLINILCFNWVSILFAFILTYYLTGITLYVFNVLFLSLYIYIVYYIMEKYMGMSLIEMVRSKIRKRQ